MAKQNRMGIDAARSKKHTIEEEEGMADASSFEAQNVFEEPGPVQEFKDSEFLDEDHQVLRQTLSWKSSPHFPTQDDVGRLRKALNNVEIISSDEDQTQKITFVQESANILGEPEDETDREFIIVPPACSGSFIQGSEIATEASSESPESISRLSRIDSAKQDIKNLRSATLGRMGKIFKIRPPTPPGHKKANETEQGIDVGVVEQQYGQDPTRKDKTHSLGRMLRLVDKDGAPRKLFSHNRTGSLTRLRKLQSTVGNVASGSEESRNIFTRMLNQFRGRNPSGANAEPNLQATNGPSSPPKPSLGTRLMMSLARGSPAAGSAGTETETAVERVAVEYTA